MPGYINEFGQWVEVGVQDSISDDTDMFNTLAEAYRTGDGNFRSDIAALAQFARLMLAKTAADAQPVSILPLSILI